MRFKILSVILLLFLTGCSSRKMSPGTARDAIIAPPQQLLEKDDIDIVHITQISGSSMVVESRVKTAFRLQKVNDVWEVRDIRIGNGEWEEVKNLSEALARVKTEQTRQMLEQIAASVREYHQDMGKMPVFEDYVDLSDVLAPKYMKSLIRLDSWRNPLRAIAVNAGTIQVVSAGPDLRFNTDDDISLAITP